MTVGKDGLPEGALADALRRAVTAGLVTADQADAVLAAERDRAASAPRAEPRRPVTEALGYLGGVLALSGAVTLAAQRWADFPIWARLAVLAGAALITGVAGALVADGSASDPARLRLRGALWLVSTIALAALVGQAVQDLTDLSPRVLLLCAGAAGALYSAALWRLLDLPLQHLCCLAGLLVAVGAAAGASDRAAPIGLAIWVVGAGWAALGWRRLLPPPVLAVVGGGLAVLAGAAITAGDWDSGAPLFGLASSAALVAVGVGTDRTAFTVVGLLGTFLFLPWTIAKFFADSIGAPVVMLISGIALLVITVGLLRRGSSRPIQR